MNIKLDHEYRELLQHCQSIGAAGYACHMAEEFSQGKWRHYLNLIARSGYALEGRTVVDFGCKFGLAAPIFLKLGASHVTGIDVVPEYVSEAGRIITPRYPSTKFLRCEDALLPIESDSVDFILANEVISHVNPTLLPTVWLEMSRVLRPGGVLLVEDGNNLDCTRVRRELPKLYEAWENGPDGAETIAGHAPVWQSFLNKRAELICQRHPELDEARVRELAETTSGMFGSQFEAAVDQAVIGNDLVARRYRLGLCPVSPLPGGMVMERAFYPAQLVMELKAYGLESIEAHQWEFAAAGISPRNLCRRLGWTIVRQLERISQRLRVRLSHENFTIRAVKKF